MFNKLMVCKELCTAGNGFQIRLALSRVEEWIDGKNVKISTGKSWKQLKKLCEAATLLTLDKSLALNNDIMKEVCPNMSIHQVKHLVMSFQTDSLMVDEVPSSLLSALEKLCKTVPEERLVEVGDGHCQIDVRKTLFLDDE